MRKNKLRSTHQKTKLPRLIIVTAHCKDETFPGPFSSCPLFAFAFLFTVVLCRQNLIEGVLSMQVSSIPNCYHPHSSFRELWGSQSGQAADVMSTGSKENNRTLLKGPGGTELFPEDVSVRDASWLSCESLHRDLPNLLLPLCFAEPPWHCKTRSLKANLPTLSYFS